MPFWNARLAPARLVFRFLRGDVEQLAKLPGFRRGMACPILTNRKSLKAIRGILRRSVQSGGECFAPISLAGFLILSRSRDFLLPLTRPGSVYWNSNKRSKRTVKL